MPATPDLKITQATLYDFPFSSASYRLRIALGLKKLTPAAVKTINLREGGQLDAEFQDIAGVPLVPIVDFGAVALGQSLAIIEWLDARYPEPRLIPEDANDALLVRSLALTIACDIHPLNVPRVLKYLKGPLGLSEETKQDWYAHWIHEGFTMFEAQLQRYASMGDFCYGPKPTLADLCLVPQSLNARRFGVTIDAFARINAIYDACLELDAFREAAPKPE